MEFDFQNVPATKKKKTVNNCFLCHGDCVLCERKITETVFNNIKENSEKLKGIGKFANVYDGTTWDSNIELYVHNNCKLDISSTRKLEIAKRQSFMSERIPSTSTDIDEQHIQAKKWRRSSGPIHQPKLCIWGLKPEDTSHKDRTNSKLHLIDHKQSWDKFRHHSVHLEDEEMRARIVTFIETCDDPYAVEVRYHASCWKKCITYKEMNIPLQNIRLGEVKIMWLEHVKEVLLEASEPRSLKTLLTDYNSLLQNFNIKTITKTATIKKMLKEEFGDRIGFHERKQRNLSAIVYSKMECGNLIDAALDSFGISDDQLLRNVAKRLHSKLKGESNMQWPPRVSELEQDGRSEALILIIKLITWAQNPSNNDFNNDSSALALSDLLLSFITGNRTLLKTQLADLLGTKSCYRCFISLGLPPHTMMPLIWNLLGHMKKTR